MGRSSVLVCGLEVGTSDLSVWLDGEGRDVGLVVSDSLVARSWCVTMLKPASKLEATSLGRAERNTSKAFSGVSEG